MPAATLPASASVRAPAARRAPAQLAAARGRVSAAAKGPAGLELPDLSEIDAQALLKTATETASSTFESLGEKKFVVVGYAAALLVGLYFVESLIHLPILNLVVAFPLELLGVSTAGVLALRYTVEGVNVQDDIDAAVAKVEATLPGFK